MLIGIDVGGTNLKAGAVAPDGTLLCARRIPLGEYRGAKSFSAGLAELALETAAAAGAEPIEAVGIGIPGAVSGGEVIYTCNLPMEHVPLAELIQKRIQVPVALGNDADCAAVGEYFCGAGRGTRNFAVITLGTGIGGGLIFGGKLYGGLGQAGEVGHMVVEKDGLPCNCGRRGCWETYASATGLIRMTREAMDGDPASLMWQLARQDGKIGGRTAFRAAAAGDETGKEVCGRYVSDLAAGIANLVNILHPEVLALGGGISNERDDLLLLPLREIVSRECYARHGGRLTRIVRAELGNDAGMIGAALLRQAR